MKPQFHKYQICEWEGREGVIIRTDYPDKGTIQFAFDNGYLYFTHDGRITPNSPVSLRPVGEARRVLTEWQEKELRRLLGDWTIQHIKSILSTPEPPKLEPKQHDLVLVKMDPNDQWMPEIAMGDGYKTLRVYGTEDWNYCIPFDPAKVGTVTND